MDSQLRQLLEDSRRILASMTDEAWDLVDQRFEQGWAYGAGPLFPIGYGAGTEVVAEARERESVSVGTVDSEATAEIRQRTAEVESFIECTKREGIRRGVALASSNVFRQVGAS